MRVTAQLRRIRTAAQRVTKALAYRARSGSIAALVETGALVRTGDILDRLGADDLKDGFKSHYGKHVAKAYRANGSEPLRAWAQHRTTGKWTHVFVYSPFDIALYVGLASYKRTAFLAQPAFFQAAYTECA